MARNIQASSCSDRRILRAMQHVMRDLTTRPPIAELAGLVGLERTYFSRHFQLATGISFSTWSRHVRAERAKDLLANTDFPVTAVAIAVGYSDVTTFERNFRKCFKVSPRQCRWAHRRGQKITTFADNSTTNAETARDAKR